MQDHFRIEPLGDTAIRVQAGTTISPEINQWILNFCALLEKEPVKGVIEWVPTYTAVSLFYHPDVIPYNKLEEKIQEIRTKIKKIAPPTPKVFRIPVYYGGDAGPDLIHVAAHNSLSPDEVINIHSGTQYLIYMIGFMPGFPYLGGMSKRIASPRLRKPRTVVPAGSVGIAGEQTGIYPLESPGGWQLIGRTPLRLYDPYRTSPVLFRAGNYLTFNPITEEEFREIEAEVQAGTYRIKTTSRRKEAGKDDVSGGSEL